MDDNEREQLAAEIEKLNRLLAAEESSTAEWKERAENLAELIENIAYDYTKIK